MNDFCFLSNVGTEDVNGELNTKFYDIIVVMQSSLCEIKMLQITFIANIPKNLFGKEMNIKLLLVSWAWYPMDGQ